MIRWKNHSLLINISVAGLDFADDFVDRVGAAVGVHLPVVLLLDFDVHRVHEDQGVADEPRRVHEVVGQLQAAEEDHDEGAEQVEAVFEDVGLELGDEEVAHDDAGHHDEDLGEGDVEVAHHVDFGQHGLGPLAEPQHFVVGWAEGLRLKDCLDVAVLAEVAEGAAVAETAGVVAASTVLLAPPQHGVQGFGNVGQDMPEYYGPYVLEHQFDGEAEAVATGLFFVLLSPLLEVPMDGDGLEEEVRGGFHDAVSPEELEDDDGRSDAGVDEGLLLGLGDAEEGVVDGDGEEGEEAEEDGEDEDVTVGPEAGLGDFEDWDDVAELGSLGADGEEGGQEPQQEGYPDDQGRDVVLGRVVLLHLGLHEGQGHSCETRNEACPRQQHQQQEHGDVDVRNDRGDDEGGDHQDEAQGNDDSKCDDYGNEGLDDGQEWGPEGGSVELGLNLLGSHGGFSRGEEGEEDGGGDEEEVEEAAEEVGAGAVFDGAVAALGGSAVVLVAVVWVHAQIQMLYAQLLNKFYPTSTLPSIIHLLHYSFASSLFIQMQSHDNRQGFRRPHNPDKLEPRKALSPRFDSKPADVIFRLNDTIILQALKDNDYKAAEPLFGELEQLIQKFDYGSNKKIYFYYMCVCYYNRACMLQQMEEYEECAKAIEKAVTNYELIQGYILNREENVAFSIDYVKLLLQFCAVMSQNSRHNEAIIYAEKSLNKLIECFRVLEAICYEHLIHNTEPQTTETSTESRSKVDKVDFKRIVIKEAERSLMELSNLPSTHKLVLETKDYFEKIMKNIYYWKNNAENNEKIVRKQLDLGKGMNSPRNILGVQKTSSWVEEFHIGTLMTLKPKSMKLSLNTDTYYLLSSQKILELVLFCSVCYFTIATETRFSEFDEDLDSLKIIEKYKKLHKDETISKCKLLHLKAIELAGKHLPPSNDFFNHLLNSFNKNYKFVLDEIKEESEMTIREFKSEELPEQLSSEYGIMRPPKQAGKKNQRKRSITKEKEKKKKNRIHSLKKNQNTASSACNTSNPSK